MPLMKEKRKKEGMEEETRAFNVGCLLDLAMLKKKRKKNPLNTEIHSIIGSAES